MCQRVKHEMDYEYPGAERQGWVVDSCIAGDEAANILKKENTFNVTWFYSPNGQDSRRAASKSQPGNKKCLPTFWGTDGSSDEWQHLGFLLCIAFKPRKLSTEDKDKEHPAVDARLLIGFTRSQTLKKFDMAGYE